MKIILVLLFAPALLLLECKSEKINRNQSENINANSMQKTDFTKKFDDLEITYSVNSAELPKVAISYEIKNLGSKSYIVLNQGHTNIAKKDDVYIEERDGIVEISQKAFTPPADVQCPPTIAPIFPRGSLLKAGSSLKGQAIIEEMRTHTPYDFCRKNNLKSVVPAKIHFCLGVAEGDAEMIDENGTAKDREIANRQKVLCSDEIVLK